MRSGRPVRVLSKKEGASCDKRTATGSAGEISAEGVAGLGEVFRGDLLVADNPGYDGARRVWNGNVDRHPALVASAALGLPTCGTLLGLGATAGRWCRSAVGVIALLVMARTTVAWS